MAIFWLKNTARGRIRIIISIQQFAYYRFLCSFPAFLRTFEYLALQVLQHFLEALLIIELRFLSVWLYFAQSVKIP